MPSLVYIARILSFSEELMDRLKAAGFQVSAFAPGRITADECLLVMTPEAAVAGLKPASSAAESTATARGSELRGTSAAEVNTHLISQAVFWNILSTAAGGPSGIGEENRNLGFIPSDAGQRIVSSRREPAGSAPSLPAARDVPSADDIDSVSAPPKLAKQAGTKPPQHIAETSSRRVAGPNTRTSPANTVPARKTLRDPFPRLAMAAGLLLILAIVLLTNPKSTLSSSGDARALAADHSSQVDSNSKISVRPSGSSSDPALTTSGGDPSKATGLPRRPANYDFVAEDFTNHLALRGHSGIAIPNSELKHNAQGRVPRKRIVFN